MQLHKSTNYSDPNKLFLPRTVLNICKYAYLKYPMTFLLISLALLLPYVALIVYYCQSWLQIPPYSPVDGTSAKNSTFITVIIVARNEEKNIGNCVESITKQIYPGNLFGTIKNRAGNDYRKVCKRIARAIHTTPGSSHY